jgi:hypothetical protein
VDHEEPGHRADNRWPVTFGYLRLTSLLFYAQLNVSPDEVGFDYKATLVASLTLIIELASLPLFVVTTFLFAERWETGAGFFEGLRGAVDAPPFKLILAMGAVGLLAVGLWQAQRAGVSTKRGHPTTPVTFFALPSLAVHADNALVYPVGDAMRKVIRRIPSCLVYLGQSGGITVLYNPTTRRSLRIASADVVIQVGAHSINACDPR